MLSRVNIFRARLVRNAGRNLLRALPAFLVLLLPIGSSSAPFPHFELLIANQTAGDRELSEFYGERGFRPIWTTDSLQDRRRLAALFGAFDSARSHGLPYGPVQSGELRGLLSAATGPAGMAYAEVRATKLYLELARALSSGALNPKSVDASISRARPVPPTESLLKGLLVEDPAAFIAGLSPSNPNYAGLRKALRQLKAIVAEGGWGSGIDAAEVVPGSSGDAVIALRNRLIRMGYLRNSASAEYDDALMFAVKRFQAEHGLDPDGEADRLTVRAINVEPEERIRQILAALERARWMNFPLGEQHILVNLPDFRASIVRHGKSVFDTRVVVGKSLPKLQTPEFSDEMTHMIVNPTWWVPRSISTGEILPKLKQDPMAEPQLVIFDPEDGSPINRSLVDFSDFTARSFPFEMRQPPGPGNALGRVKFMFPNRFNVYMHDTPWRALFQRERRSFSHGCVRVHRAFDLAHFLLNIQSDDPGAILDGLLSEGRETRINLAESLPVHITYRTAWVAPDGRTNFRADIYGRDELIYERLAEAGLDAGFLSN